MRGLSLPFKIKAVKGAPVIKGNRNTTAIRPPEIPSRRCQARLIAQPKQTHFFIKQPVFLSRELGLALEMSLGAAKAVVDHAVQRPAAKEILKVQWHSAQR